ncbi:unnamed protein product [Effrenium voratum]|nr:unnamed protein product [Effrenium voratum]
MALAQCQPGVWQGILVSLAPFVPLEAFRWQLLSKRISAELLWPQVFEGLDLTGRCIGPEGALALSRRLPRTQRKLSLDVSECGLGREGLRYLAEALPETLTALHLDVGRNGLEGADLEVLLRRLPAKAQRLELGLAASGLGPQGASDLAARLPPTLKELFLDLSFCRCGDGLLQAVGQLPLTHLELKLVSTGLRLSGLRSLPPTLQELRLDLDRLEDGRFAWDWPPGLRALEITSPALDLPALLPALAELRLRDLRLDAPKEDLDAGVFFWLGQCLPPCLKRLELDCLGSPSATKLSLLLQQLPSNLTQLRLECGQSQGGHQDPLANDLPNLRGLTHLDLGLSGCISAAGLEALLLAVPDVRVLRLDAYRSEWSNLAKGAAQLAKLSSLSDLELCLGMCPRLEDEDVAAILQHLPPSLRRLSLDVSSTETAPAGVAAASGAL